MGRIIAVMGRILEAVAGKFLPMGAYYRCFGQKIGSCCRKKSTHEGILLLIWEEFWNLLMENFYPLGRIIADMGRILEAIAGKFLPMGAYYRHYG